MTSCREQTSAFSSTPTASFCKSAVIIGWKNRRKRKSDWSQLIVETAGGRWWRVRVREWVWHRCSHHLLFLCFSFSYSVQSNSEQFRDVKLLQTATKLKKAALQFGKIDRVLHSSALTQTDRPTIHRFCSSGNVMSCRSYSRWHSIVFCIWCGRSVCGVLYRLSGAFRAIGTTSGRQENCYNMWWNQDPTDRKWKVTAVCMIESITVNFVFWLWFSLSIRDVSCKKTGGDDVSRRLYIRFDFSVDCSYHSDNSVLAILYDTESYWILSRSQPRWNWVPWLSQEWLLWWCGVFHELLIPQFPHLLIQLWNLIPAIGGNHLASLGIQNYQWWNTTNSIFSMQLLTFRILETVPNVEKLVVSVSIHIFFF
jgi:hypothetical protein